MTLIVGEIAL